MRYCLDTNMIVFCLRGKAPKVMARLSSTPASDIVVPMQVLAELRLGAAKSAKPLQNRAAVESFLRPFQVIWPDASTVDHYVDIRVALEAQGLLIGEADLWIAATARSLGSAVITNNAAEFNRVPGLVVEDWSV